MEILFSKAAICYYLMGIFCQYHWIFGKALSRETGKENTYSYFFYTETSLGAIFLIYYSFKTHWWAIIPLYLINLIVYAITNQITEKTNSPGDTRARLANLGLVAGPILIISMYYLIYVS